MQGYPFPASMPHTAHEPARQTPSAAQRIKDAEQRLAAYQQLPIAPMAMSKSDRAGAPVPPQFS